MGGGGQGGSMPPLPKCGRGAGAWVGDCTPHPPLSVLAVRQLVTSPPHRAHHIARRHIRASPTTRMPRRLAGQRHWAC